MRTLEDSNPIVIFLFFVLTAGLTMFIAYPPLLFVSLLGGMAYLGVLGRGSRRFHIFAWLLFVVLAAANPVVSHKGSTVLLMVNDRPITLESFIYGINSALMIIAALYWFYCLTLVMTGDKLIYVTSFLSRRLSLVISMAIRFVPLFARQIKKVKDAQKAMGLYNDDSITDDIKANMRVYSIVITWALENGITTADSMEARGYSLGKRSCYRIAHFSLEDACRAAAAMLLFACVLAVRLTGGLYYRFYPNVKIDIGGTPELIGLAAFCALSFMPSVISLEVKLRWKRLRSQI